MRNPEDIGRISKSGLDLIARSPYHYWYKYINPDFVWGSDETPSTILGNLVHVLTLEPENFDNKYAMPPSDINRRTNDGKKEWAEFEASVGRRKLITADMLQKAHEIRDGIMRNPSARWLIESPGRVEETLRWVDPTTACKLKARLDKITDSGYIVDIKTTEDAGPGSFSKSVLNWRYHVQGAMYLDGELHADGVVCEGFAFVAIETKPPYCCAVYFLDDEAMALGRATYINDIRRYQECLRTNTWPGYPDKPQILQLPRWAFPK